MADQLRIAIGPHPDWIIVFHTGSVAPEFAQQVTKTAFPNTAIHGCSSSSAVFGGDGIVEDPCIGVLAIADPGGAFGTGLASFAQLAPADAARRAVEQAITVAGRRGAIPDFIWLSAVPGCEEAVIAGIEQVAGASVPIVGGSAALNGLGGTLKASEQVGRCVVFDRDAIVDDGLLLSAGFVTERVCHGFFGGYRATEKTGIVTATAGRALLTIDGQPAAQVYDRWSDGLITEEIANNGEVVTQTTMSPIGVTVGHVGTAPLYGLVHPVQVENGALRVHTVIPEGSRVTLMTGDQDILVHRTAELVERTRALFDASTPQVVGGLISYCAGCARPLAERNVEMVDLVRDALGGAPFMGGFFFGEQGRFWNNCNSHANLMVSLLLFEDHHVPSSINNRMAFRPPAFQNDLALGYQIIKARLDEVQKTNALLRVGLARIAQARSRGEVFKAVGDSLEEVIDYDGFAILRQIDGIMVCTSSSAERIIGTAWHEGDHGAFYRIQKPTLLGDAKKSRLWNDNPSFFQALRPGSAIHLGFQAEDTPLHIIMTHHAINGFGLTDRDILYVMSPFIHQALENVAHLRQMEKLATTDYLTGISNRGHFLELATLELARSKRFGRPTSVLMIDADHFKNINDRYGHDAGDAALLQLATLVGRELRKVDIFGRLGGEEFAVLVVETDRAKATQVGERIRAVIESTPIVQHDYRFGMTVSIGVAVSPTSTAGIETLLTEADRALYAAKRAGRNRVLNASDVPDTSDWSI
ncbi:MAG: diguanylate cyclase [Candidatus Competibacteraceae bacterium]|nr:diguanylate cyclase [Candidatus Competibacteraceae bacterium]